MRLAFSVLTLLFFGSLLEARPYDRQRDWPRYYDSDEEVDGCCEEYSADRNMNFGYEAEEETNWPTNIESSFYERLTE